MELQENKAVCFFEVCKPKEHYLNPPNQSKITLGYIALKFLMPFLIAEVLILGCLDKNRTAEMGIQFVLFLSVYLIVYVAIPRHRNKEYEKIHNEGKDCFTYTFYKDHVNIHSASGSCVLLRTDAEKLSEDFSYIYVEFRNHEPLCIEKQQCSAKEHLFLESFIPVRPKPVIHRSPTSEEYSIVFNVFLLLAVLSYMGYLLVQMDPFLH